MQNGDLNVKVRWYDFMEEKKQGDSLDRRLII